MLRTCIDDKKTYFFFKRFFDIIVSLFFIVFVLSWLLPVLTVLIRLDSAGPVFFLQKRIGRNGRIFTCCKFRTMVVNKQADEMAAIENDPRITRIGKWLRQLNLDEFPQFFNILMGSMSLIGPRPHMVIDCKRFSSLIPEYEWRNLIRPGITGLAQVKGFHGPAMNTDTIFLRYENDIYYIRHANFSMDLRILGKTMRDSTLNVWKLVKLFFSLRMGLPQR